MKKTKAAFTLAEIMIVLTVIGVLTAILMPAAMNSAPDESVMKFKKGHNVLMKVIAELVNSDKYYKDGNLAIRANGNYITGDNIGDVTYFCESFADVITTNSVNCNEEKITAATRDAYGKNKLIVCSDWPDENIINNTDSSCKSIAETMGAEVVASDGITYYQAGAIPFGTDDYGGTSKYLFLETVGAYNNAGNSAKGIDSGYRCSKIFCMDTDGIGKGEDPFGYAIRADGKVIIGARAQEWLKKDFQNKE